MGKNSQIIGFKYRAGLRFVLGQATVDALIKWRIADKDVFCLYAPSGQISVNKPDLLGGQDKEGGVSGVIDVENGAADQDENDYMLRVLDRATIPAWRDKFSLIFRNFWIGNNPFLKPMWFQVRGIYAASDNWYPEKAPINPEYCAEDNFLYIALENSTAMYGGADGAVAKGALKRFINSLRGTEVTIKIVAFSTVVDDQIEVEAATEADYDSIITWIDALVESPSGTLDIAPDISSPTLMSSTIGQNVPYLVGGATFYPEGWAAANESNVTTDPLFGDAHPNNNAADGSLVLDIDISGYATGTAFTFVDELVISANINATVNDQITIFGVTAAQLAADTQGTQIAIRNNLIAGTPSRTVNRSLGFTKSSSTYVVARAVINLDGAFYSGGFFRYARVSQPAVEVAGTGADWEQGVSLADTFFAGAPATGGNVVTASDENTFLSGDGDAATNDVSATKNIVFVSRGVPLPTSSRPAAEVILDAMTDTPVYAHQINNADTTESDEIDTTPVDGVPNITSADSDQISVSFAGDRPGSINLNPAHILRRIEISPLWGGAGDSSVVGDTFTAAADTLYSEGMGMTISGNPGQKDEFKAEIERHIDAVVYDDPLTEKREIKLIRDDYDVGTLETFGQSRIVEWLDLERPLQEELPNQVTVKFRKRENGEEDSVTLHNIAAIQQVGYVNPLPIEYPGFDWPELAARIAARDLVANTVPFWKGSVRLTDVPLSINLGSPIIIDDDRMGINSVVCRVQEMDRGDGRDSSVLIRFVEDRFAIDDDPIVSTPGTVKPSKKAVAPATRFIQEAPYWSIVRDFGEAEIDSRLDNDPDSGSVVATTEKPNLQHIDLVIAQEDGGSYRALGRSEFSAFAPLDAALSKDPTETTFTTPYTHALSRVKTGTLAAVGTEMLRVESMVNTAGSVTVTVGRGCLDTVPQAHAAGAVVTFWSGTAAIPYDEYTGGETVNFKLLPRTSEATLSPDAATADPVTFDSRAIRPYPAGQFQVNGGYLQASDFVPNSAFAWATRDRTLQTTATPEIFTDGDVGLEAGTTYTFSIEAFDQYENSLGVYSSTSKGTDASHTVADLTDAPAGTYSVEFYVTPARDGYDAWQTYRYRRFAPDYRLTEDGETRRTEAGDARSLEQRTVVDLKIRLTEIGETRLVETGETRKEE